MLLLLPSACLCFFASITDRRGTRFARALPAEFAFAQAARSPTPRRRPLWRWPPLRPPFTVASPPENGPQPCLRASALAQPGAFNLRFPMGQPLLLNDFLHDLTSLLYHNLTALHS